MYAGPIYKSLNQTAIVTTKSWRTPNDEWININFDANMVNNGDRGLRVVARNARG